jgi:hypothetical protein
MGGIIKLERLAAQVFQKSLKIMLPRLRVCYIPRSVSPKTENGGFYSEFNANADNQSTGPQGPHKS